MGEAPQQRKDVFGDVAVELGFLTPAQLNDILQARQGADAPPKPIGEALVEGGVLTREQLAAVLREQARRRVTRERMVGKFKILEKIGAGGMGAVYRVRDTETGKQVALKILPPSLAADATYLKRFLQEASVASQIFDHDHIVKGLGAGQSEGLYYFSMEFVDGENMQQMLSRTGRFPEETALQIVLPVARALQHAFFHGLLHQDIKPENIIMDRKGTAKLLDLGLARRTGDLKSARLGTPLYVSPEQITGNRPMDIRSDIYSLGVTLYHMVVGRPPFVGSDDSETMNMHLSRKVPPPQEIVPELSENICLVISRMLAKDPDERYANPKELLYDLDSIIDGHRPHYAVEGPEPGASRAPAAPPSPRPRKREGAAPARARAAEPGVSRRRRRPRAARPPPSPFKNWVVGIAIIAVMIVVAAFILAFITS